MRDLLIPSKAAGKMKQRISNGKSICHCRRGGYRPFPYTGAGEADPGRSVRGKDFALLLPKEDATHLLHLAWEAEHRKYWTSPLNLRWPK